MSRRPGHGVCPKQLKLIAEAGPTSLGDRYKTHRPVAAVNVTHVVSLTNNLHDIGHGNEKEVTPLLRIKRLHSRPRSKHVLLATTKSV